MNKLFLTMFLGLSAQLQPNPVNINNAKTDDAKKVTQTKAKTLTRRKSELVALAKPAVWKLPAVAHITPEELEARLKKTKLNNSRLFQKKLALYAASAAGLCGLFYAGSKVDTSNLYQQIEPYQSHRPWKEVVLLAVSVPTLLAMTSYSGKKLLNFLGESNDALCAKRTLQNSCFLLANTTQALFEEYSAKLSMTPKEIHDFVIIMRPAIVNTYAALQAYRSEIPAAKKGSYQGCQQACENLVSEFNQNFSGNSYLLISETKMLAMSRTIGRLVRHCEQLLR